MVLLMYGGLRASEGLFHLWFKKISSEGHPVFTVIGDAGQMSFGR